jgi:hypothetical protein
MKKLLGILIFWPVIFGCESIWDNGPTQLLKEIFAITKIKDTEDLEKAIKKSTFRWIRPKFMERWHSYSLLDKSQRNELEKLIKNSDLAKVKMPKKNHYDVVVVLGGVAERVQMRINFLINLHNQGVTFDKIYLLGSTRNIKTVLLKRQN